MPSTLKEMTIYMIEQNKKIAALQKQNEILLEIEKRITKIETSK